MNILVTGGAGYIGSVVCELLEAKGHSLIILDDLRDGNEKAVSKECSFYKADFGDSKVLDKVFSTHKVDFVFHFAASANVPDSVRNPLDYYLNNVSNTITLLNKMRLFDVNKIIFSSTAAVYGEPKYTPIDEKHALLPINPYGFSKLMTEQIIRDCEIAYGLKYIIFRYFCAAGATELHGEARTAETHLIPVVLDHVLGNRDVVYVFGSNFKTKDGSGIRDYIHVEDIAEAHILGMESIDKYPNNIYNIGTNEGYSVFEVINRVSKLLNVKVKYEIVEERPGDPGTLVATSGYVENHLGWKPKKKLEDIILSAYNWFNNPKY